MQKLKFTSGEVINNSSLYFFLYIVVSFFTLLIKNGYFYDKIVFKKFTKNRKLFLKFLLENPDIVFIKKDSSYLEEYDKITIFGYEEYEIWFWGEINNFSILSKEDINIIGLNYFSKSSEKIANKVCAILKSKI
jgi:hypothetical protein